MRKLTEVAGSFRGRNLDLIIHQETITTFQHSQQIPKTSKSYKYIYIYDLKYHVLSYTYHFHIFYQNLRWFFFGIKTTGATLRTYHHPSLCPSHHVFWAKGLLQQGMVWHVIPSVRDAHLCLFATGDQANHESNAWKRMILAIKFFPTFIHSEDHWPIHFSKNVFPVCPAKQ